MQWRKQLQSSRSSHVNAEIRNNCGRGEHKSSRLTSFLRYRHKVRGGLCRPLAERRQSHARCEMGLEATWSLVDIPVDARDAAQAAARREGVSVGEWLTRRILKRFSELNIREQEDAFIALRKHVAELADRLERFEDRSRVEPMREALKRLHQGLTRLNDEL